MIACYSAQFLAVRMPESDNVTASVPSVISQAFEYKKVILKLKTVPGVESVVVYFQE